MIKAWLQATRVKRWPCGTWPFSSSLTELPGHGSGLQFQIVPTQGPSLGLGWVSEKTPQRSEVATRLLLPDCLSFLGQWQ